MLIVLVGVRGAGKSTLLNKMQGIPGISILQPSTTRSPRSENDLEYEFVEEWDYSRYAWTIRVERHFYGTRHDEVNRASGGICLTVADPLTLDNVKSFCGDAPFEVVIVGLDTVSSYGSHQQRIGDDPLRTMTEADFREARKIVSDCDVVLRGDADTVADAMRSVIRLLSSRGGMLVRNDIERLIRAGALLENADLNHVRPASYDLRIGNQIWCQGKLTELSEISPRFDIPPYSYAIVSASEIASLPAFVTGRFDLKVSMFFSGIVLSNGPQVDPGYRGALFCMLFNGNSRERTIIRGNHFATIEFSTTTITTEGYKQQYQFQARLERVMSEETFSAPGGTIFEIIDQKISAIDQKVSGIKAEWWTLVAVIVALIAIPATILFVILWDSVKEADAIVTRMKGTQREVTLEFRNQRQEGVKAIQDAVAKALQEIAAQRQSPPAR